MTGSPTGESPGGRWHALEALGLRETFLLAVPTAADRERLVGAMQAEFEALLECHGFAPGHASIVGALVAAAGRDLDYVAELLAAAAEDEWGGDGEPALSRRHLGRVRHAVSALERLAGSLEALAASLEAEAAPGDASTEGAAP